MVINETSKYRLTIIVPVYNEENNIERLGEVMSGYLRQAKVSTAVLFVNDGSKDKSMERIKSVCSVHSDFFYVSLLKNRGLSAAIKAGIDTIESEYTGYIDADLQTSPEDFDLLLVHIADYAMVTGIRTGRKDSFVKKVSSKIANGFRRMMTGDGIEDTGCPLKIIKTEYAKRIPLFNGMHRFLPALVQLQYGRVKQVPVRHFPRLADESKYNLFNRLLGPMMDCFAFRWMKSRYISYMIDQTNVQR